MTTGAERGRACRERKRRALLDDVVELVVNAHHAALYRTLDAVPVSTLRSMHAALSEAPGATRAQIARASDDMLRDHGWPA